jgi:uncharacterized membrane protein
MYFKKYVQMYVVFAIVLILIRMAISNSFKYAFLPWNLLLAYVPLFITTTFCKDNTTVTLQNKTSLSQKLKATLLAFLPLKKLSIVRNFIVFCIWLLFLPNAPYIITDMLHLKERLPIPYFFDITLVFIYASLGLVFFITSVLQMENYWRKHFKYSIIIFYLLAFGLCSFGIYLGRFGRFNSWNVINNPVDLLLQIADRFIYPLQHPRTWAVTLLYSCLLFFMYKIIQQGLQYNKVS